MMLELSMSVGVTILLVAFVAEYFDSTLGMGYGTSLTPVLLMCGFEPMQIVPSILLSELLTGFTASLVHHHMGNVELFTLKKINIKNARFSSLKRINNIFSYHMKVSLLIGFSSIIGTIIAVKFALALPKFWIKMYIGILVATMGLLILLTSKKIFKFSWNKIIGLSILASFNKGISGGGYGPVVTSGQLLSGVEGKNAIGITSFAESLTCLVGLLIYIFSDAKIDWSLAPFLIIGGLLSVPFSGISVKKIKAKKLRMIIGIITLLLGLLTLVKITFN